MLKQLPLIFMLALISFACDSSVYPGTPEDGGLDQGGRQPVSQEDPAAENVYTFDDEMAEVGLSVPGFGGAFIDDNGQLVMLVKDAVSKRPIQARQGVVEALRMAEPQSERSVLAQLQAVAETTAVEVRSCEYDFAELVQWKRAARALLDDPELVSLDVDEASNRVVIGVQSPGASDRLRMRLTETGLPVEAVLFVEDERPSLGLASTDDLRYEAFRPVVSGASIYVCTVGVNVIGRDGARYFLTNAHCASSYPYRNTRKVFRNGFPIGETVDVSMEAPGSSPSQYRYYSDLALVKYYPDVSSSNYVARPDLWGSRLVNVNDCGNSDDCGSNPSTGQFTRIRGWSGSLLRGQEVEKVGKTTGHTRGRVTRTCYDTGVNRESTGGKNVIKLCQGEYEKFDRNSKPLINQGDSGSAVYRVLPHSRYDPVIYVTIDGINWGESENRAVFTPTSCVANGLCTGFINFSIQRY